MQENLLIELIKQYFFVFLLVGVLIFVALKYFKD